MPFLSVIICSHNPQPVYLERTLASLAAQTLSRSEWEVLLIDNNSRQPLANQWDLSWHQSARHVREEKTGLTVARMRGIAESRGDLLVFVDDDNVLAPDYLTRSRTLHQSHPDLGAFGAGALEPEFEIPPAPQLRPWLSMLALRTVSAPERTTDWSHKGCIPWGAGLCVTRPIADAYAALVTHLNVTLLDRCGDRLFCGGDDLFSFVASEQGASFGIFPDLRIQHLISSARLSENYIVRLVHDHAYSHAILQHRLTGAAEAAARPAFEHIRVLLHGLRHGRLAMKCRIAAARGAAAAAELIQQQEWQPLEWRLPTAAKTAKGTGA